FETPIVVLEHIEGETVFALADAPDLLPQFARHLAAIHRIDCAAHDITFLPDHAAHWGSIIGNRPARLDDSLSEGRIRDALEAAWPWPQRNASVLLHGDYWPGNILWRDGRLVGIVDWEDAAIGDPLADIAISRLDLLWAFGADAMERFTREYAAAAPIDFAHLHTGISAPRYGPRAGLATGPAMRRPRRGCVSGTPSSSRRRLSGYPLNE